MNFIEELYYGNINPNEKRYKKATPYDKALCPPSKNRHKKASKNEMNRSISLIY